MNVGQDEAAESVPTDGIRPPRGYCWMSTMDLEPGMVIARPVLSGSGGQSHIRLAVGSSITASTISQLVNKGVECVAVLQETSSDDAMFADLMLQYEGRLREIFGQNPDGNCAALFDALLAGGPI